MPVDDVSVPQEGSDSNSDQPPADGPNPASIAAAHQPGVDPSSASPGRVETPAEARRSIIRWVGGMVAFVVVAAVVGGILLKVPYVALVPGSARDTEPLLEVEGIEQFPSDGELLLLTVRFRTRPNLWEYLLLRMDGDAEVVPEQNVFGDRTPEENRDFNLELMNGSKQLAVAVALEQLGYDAVGTDAVAVQRVEPDLPADGLLVPGDSILSIDGEPTPSTIELVEILETRAPEESVSLEVQAFGDETIRVVDVVLGEHPDKPGSGFLGIVPADRLDYNEDFDFVVDIDSGSVGGPSAGLAFTLAVLDQLTAGELTGGATVAVTGTINASGEVGPVGGVVQKAAAVRDLGVDVFIVPAALDPQELAEVKRRAEGEFEVIPVSTLDDALDALAATGGNVDVIDEFATANRAEG